MADYGTIAGMQAYIRHMTFDAPNNPTTAQAQQWLDEQSMQLNAWLAQQGYAIPVVNANARLILDKYANIGAAGLAELAQRGGGYSKDNQNKRENKFLDEFARAEAFIESGVLASLGASQATAQGPLFGLFVGGRTSSGQQLRPMFSRTSFGNDPTAERGTREPGYDGDP